jgi:hypothetical protein
MIRPNLGPGIGAAPGNVRVGALPLLQPGVLRAPMILRRRQVGRTTAIQGDGTQKEYMQENTPRFIGGDQRLLLEPGFVNGTTNPRAWGGVGSNLPAGWQLSAMSNGIAAVVSGFPEYMGMTGVEITLSGTATANAGISVGFYQLLAYPVASQGQVWNGSWYQRLVSGDTPTNNSQVRFTEMAANGTTGLGNRQSMVPKPASDLARVSVNSVALISADTAFIRFGSLTNLLNGTTANQVIQLFWPQLVLADFTTSAIVNHSGVTGLFPERGGESLYWPFEPAGVRPGSPFTIVHRFFPYGVSSNQMLARAELGGTPGDGYWTRLTSAGDITLNRTTGGVDASATLGAASANVLQQTAWAVFGDGSARGCANGGAIQGVAGGPVGSLPYGRAGRSPTGTEQFYGEFAYFDILPYAADDTELVSLTSA